MEPSTSFVHSASAPEWDRVADVVVIGYGGAGASAAIAAHDDGADVLILESTPQGGGNTLVSFGGFLCPTAAEDARKYISGLYALSLSEKNEALIRVFAEESTKNIDWVQGLKDGVEVLAYGGASYPGIQGAESMKKYLIKGEGKGATIFARNLWQLLSHAVEQDRKIPVMTRTPARRLVTNARGRVTGVLAETHEGELAVCAKRAVILATGGYEFDAKILQNSVKGFPIYALGSPGNKGDGIRMAQYVGAALWHMNGVSCSLGIKVPDIEPAIGMVINHPGHIFVDKLGKRFVNEAGIESHAGLLAVDAYDTHRLEYPRIPLFAIFDERTRLKGVISASAGLGAASRFHDWSKDNSVEIEKGWIVRGNSVSELAEKLKLDPDTLENTVKKWNHDVQRGEDTLFGRSIPQDSSSAAISAPPFYALEIYPCLLNTQGGPRRNENAQVLNAFGDPIPGLYSAGELGSMWGMIYQGAGNIAECMVFGRIAGKNSAAEHFRDQK